MPLTTIHALHTNHVPRGVTITPSAIGRSAFYVIVNGRRIDIPAR